MSVFISSVAGAAAQFFDNSGNVLTGGKLYTYLAGTTTFADTYTSSTGTVLNTNPIILDSAGRVPEEIWFAENQTYKFVLTDADDVLLGTWDNLVGVYDIPDGSITTAKLADDSVTTAKLVDGSVTVAKLATDSVTTAKLVDGSVTAAKLATNSVTTVKIVDLNVTTSKIADGAITTAKLANANVTADKLEHPYVFGTAETLTGESSVTMTGIPTWATKITVIFSNVTTSSTDVVLLKVGSAAGGITVTGYVSTMSVMKNAVSPAVTSPTTTFQIDESNTSSIVRKGVVILAKSNNNTWTYSSNCSTTYPSVVTSVGEIDNGATPIDRVQLSTASTFGSGTMNISYQ